ncbi:hypothetical protein D3C81_1677880 [compost metagenome]
MSRLKQFSRFVLFVGIYTLIPLSIIFTISFLNQYINEMERSDIYSLGSIMTWIIGYYVVGLINIIYFSKKLVNIKFFLFWIVGQELIGLGIVFFAFKESINNKGGFAIFDWDFGIWIFTMPWSFLYSLIYLLVSYGIIHKKFYISD